jgi:hypothetical protein
VANSELYLQTTAENWLLSIIIAQAGWWGVIATFSPLRLTRDLLPATLHHLMPQMRTHKKCDNLIQPNAYSQAATSGTISWWRRMSPQTIQARQRCSAATSALRVQAVLLQFF